MEAVKEGRGALSPANESDVRRKRRRGRVEGWAGKRYQDKKHNSVLQSNMNSLIRNQLLEMALNNVVSIQ